MDTREVTSLAHCLTPAGRLSPCARPLCRRPGIGLRTCFSMLLFWFCLLPGLMTAAEFQTPAISVEDLNTRRGTPEAYLVVDVRDDKEYRKGHIPGAINIPVEELASHLDELHSPNGVVVYCIVGRRTRQAEQTLLDNGLENIFHIEHGFSGWLSANYPVMKGRKP